MIERLLTPGSILELAVRSCVTRKDILRLFALDSWIKQTKNTPTILRLVKTGTADFFQA